jgi:hypothetical protein
MKTLLIKSDLTQADLVELSAQWDNEENIAIKISPESKGAEFRRLICLMVTELPNNFFYTALETLAQHRQLPADEK